MHVRLHVSHIKIEGGRWRVTKVTVWLVLFFMHLTID